MTDHEKQVIFEMASINKLPLIRQKCIEELAELIRAISRGDVENILEETCDTEITILLIEKNKPPLFVWFYCVLGMVLGILAAAYL